MPTLGLGEPVAQLLSELAAGFQVRADEELTVKELRERARALDLSGPLSRLRKTELLERVASARQPGPPPRLLLDVGAAAAAGFDAWAVELSLTDRADLWEVPLDGCILCLEEDDATLVDGLRLVAHEGSIYLVSDDPRDWSPTGQLLRVTRFRGRPDGEYTPLERGESLSGDAASEAYYAMPPFRELDAYTHAPDVYHLLRYGQLEDGRVFSIAASGDGQVKAYESWELGAVVDSLMSTAESFEGRQMWVDPSPWVRDFFGFGWRGQPADTSADELQPFFQRWLDGEEAGDPAEPGLARSGAAREDATETDGQLAPPTSAESDSRAAIASVLGTAEEVLVQLALDPDVDVRRSAAGDSSSPPELLERLADDETETVRERITWNPSAPPEALRKLTTLTNQRMRRAVAVHANTPVDALEVLAADSEWLVRLGVAENTAAPPDVLRGLAAEFGAVGAALDMNPATPPDVMERRIRDGDAYTWARLLENPSLPDALRPLIAEKRCEVRQGGMLGKLQDAGAVVAETTALCASHQTYEVELPGGSLAVLIHKKTDGWIVEMDGMTYRPGYACTTGALLLRRKVRRADLSDEQRRAYDLIRRSGPGGRLLGDSVRPKHARQLLSLGLVEKLPKRMWRAATGDGVG